MLDLNVVDQELIAGKPYFKAISPGMPVMFKPGYPRLIVKGTLKSWQAYKTFREWRRGRPVSDIVGEKIANKVNSTIVSPVSAQVTKAHMTVKNQPTRDMRRKNGMGGRSWISDPGRYDMVIIFHDANRAGPHVDVHIGRLSLIYRVKPHIYEQLKYNSSGVLTAKSQAMLMDFVRDEIETGSRVPQNLDHSRKNARSTWYDGDTEGTSYGDGKTRQVISESKVDVYKAHDEGPIEFYAPALNPHRGMYIYKIYEGNDKRVPICIWGNRAHNPPLLQERLHLKLIDPDNIDKLADKADLKTSTAKYDGSSCYVTIDKKGTRVWSPRKSVKTGEQIEYTFKLDDIASVTSDTAIVAMGELLFKRQGAKQDDYIAQAEASGVLNSNLVTPEDLIPEIRLYRVDRIGRTNTHLSEFWENRELQEHVASLSRHFKVVELMTPEDALAKGFEGIVAVPENGSVVDGFKTKWWEDPDDWRIDDVEFKPGPSGKVAGVIRCTSLMPDGSDGKKFKLGPGQVGDEILTTDMMNRPCQYEGKVIKVRSRPGHEGRAAKLLSFHDDKGLG